MINPKYILTILGRLLINLKKICKSRIVFSKVKKSEILIFGTPSYINILNKKKYKFLKFKDINFFHLWGESYNFFILMKCLLNFKFDFLYYSNQYISACNPKIILTFLDNYKIFYLLKKNKFQKKILVQGSFRSNESNQFKRNNKFLENKVDYIFTQNKEIGKKYSLMLKGKTYPVGSFLSNDVPLPKIKKKKIYDLVYISTFRFKKKETIINKNITMKEYLQCEREFVKKIQKYANDKNRKLHILCTNKLFQRQEELKFFDEIFENKNWNMIKRSSNEFNSTYDILDKSNVVLGIDSTVLYETFARGGKTAFFDIRPTNDFLKKNRHFAWPAKLNKSGPFWTDKNDYNAITKLINKVYNYDEKSWLNINKKFKDRIMSYDENNKTFSLVLKKIIN